MAYKVIEIKASVFADNNRQAEALRRGLKEQGVFLLNLMSSPGSGKTTLLRSTIGALKGEMDIAVMEADIDSDVDAAAVEAAGARGHPAAYRGYVPPGRGNDPPGPGSAGDGESGSGCPGERGESGLPGGVRYGAAKNAMILSVPEGDDKPLKYPLMFSVCDVLLINKTDVLPYFDFDLEACCRRALERNPKLRIFPVSARTGQGMDAWYDWLRDQVRDWKCKGEF